MAINTLRLTADAATHNIHNGKADIRVHGAYNEIDFVAEVNPATGLSVRDQRRTAVEIRHSTFEPDR
jgi:hypothetical protein